MSIQTLDLGNVTGPTGATGPQGPQGRSLYLGASPDPDAGSDGDCFIVTDADSEDYGTLYKKSEGQWEDAVHFNMEGAAVDTAIDGESTNPVENRAIKAALDEKVDAEDGKGLSANDYDATEKASVAASAEYVAALKTPTYADITLDGAGGAYGGRHRVGRVGRIAFVEASENRTSGWYRNINSSNEHTLGTIPSGFRPTMTQYVWGRALCGADKTVHYAAFWIESAGRIRVAAVRTIGGATVAIENLRISGMLISTSYITAT